MNANIDPDVLDFLDDGEQATLDLLAQFNGFAEGYLTPEPKRVFAYLARIAGAFAAVRTEMKRPALAESDGET